MSEIELVTLRRAALVLFLISLGRWWVGYGPTSTHSAGSTEPSAEALAQLSERTREASDDAQRRARPLAAGERIDPNVAHAVELDRLPGVGASTASAIEAARSAGVVFRRAEDLAHVRGIGHHTVERLRPHLTFEGAGHVSRPDPRTSIRAASRGARAPALTGSALPPTVIDVNRASAEALTALPGIGPALAERIVEARRAGRFRTLDELTRVRGIGPATVARLDGLVRVGPAVR